MSPHLGLLKPAALAGVGRVSLQPHYPLALIGSQSLVPGPGRPLPCMSSTTVVLSSSFPRPGERLGLGGDVVAVGGVVFL